MPNQKGKRTCDDCRYCFNEDYGYSNYTTEGTQFRCIKAAHPKGDFDRFYGETPDLEYAQQCPEFKPGNSFSMDVEGENANEPPVGTQQEVINEMKAHSLITGEQHWLLIEMKQDAGRE